MSPDLDAARLAVERIAAAGAVLSSLEWLAQPAKVGDRGLFSWEVFKLRQRWMIAGPAAHLFQGFFASPGILLLLALRLALAVLLLVLPAAAAAERTFAVVLLAAFALLLRFRSPVGLDGSDQMSTLLFTVLALSTAGGRLAQTACLWFVAGQACLAYATSGWLKVREKGWRDGTYLARVLSSTTYGHGALGPYLKEHLALSRGLSLAFIGFECAFPLVLFLPLPLVWAFLAGALLFHLGTAAIMGLNTFVWSFAATFPALVFCRAQLPW